MPHLDLLFVAAYPTSFFTSPTEFAATAIAHGARLFAANCVVCHGAEARGDGPAAQSLPSAPADLTAEHFRAHSDGELYWFISHGFATPEGSVTMPGFAGVLSSEAIWHLIDYLRAHNAGDAMRRTGSWPQPLPMPQFDAQCADGRIIDLDDLRGRALRIIAVSDDESTRPPLPDDVGAATVLVRATWQQGRPARPALRASRRFGRRWPSSSGCRRMRWPARRCWSIATRWLRAAWRPGDAEDWTRSTHRRRADSRHSRPSACHRSVRGARAPSLMVVASALPRRPDAAPAVLLWLDHPGLRVLRRVLAPGRRGRHAVDLRRADDARLRLVAHRAVRRSVAGRRAGRAVVADARPHAGSSAARGSCCASRC